VGRYLGKVMVAGPNPAEGSILTSDMPLASLPNCKCIYMHMHIVYVMTKVISLSEKAYQTLKGMKKPGESFSDVVLRVGGQANKKSILEFAGTWKGDDIDEVFAIVMKDREQSKSREFEM
jgi:predicted CopG family antitoxin